ncbi:energy-coupling factor transporter transmembrane protein EcfT [bacterium]|nr:energy-coupling factor transporter transmembrane protein EcfT [bacterium]MCI0602051.1 energy-coupling factor transporter transmembrane protein EcfT [bacterium]
MYLYQEANTPFHSLHPVTKLLMLLFCIVIPFLAKTFLVTAIILAFYVTLLLFARGAGNVKKFWKMLLIFWIFTFAIWSVVPKIRGSEWSFENAALLATRIDTFVLAGLLFVTITRIEEFTFALTRIGIPYKVAFTLSLGFRLVPLFYQNLQTIVAAQKSRGVDLESGGLSVKARKYGPMIAALISYSLRNADLMAMSLEAKGFGYPGKRTSYLEPKISWRDALVFVCIALILFTLLR